MRNLAIEVAVGKVVVRGSVRSDEQRQRAMEALAGAHAVDIVARPVAAIDRLDGRGP
jgi:hypothetical protein